MDTLTANLNTLSLSEEQTDSVENLFSKVREFFNIICMTYADN